MRKNLVFLLLGVAFMVFQIGCAAFQSHKKINLIRKKQLLYPNIWPDWPVLYLRIRNLALKSPERNFLLS